MTERAAAPYGVLLVEDDPSFARWVELELQLDFPQPIAVTTAHDLRTALRLLGEGSFDAILLDLMLPDSKGYETFERVMRAAGKALVIVVTGIQDEGLAFKTLEHGAQDYLLKENLEPGVVRHSILWAKPRHELRVRREDGSTSAPSDEDDPTPIRLKVRDPETFDSLAHRYSQLLDHVVGRWIHKTGEDLGDDVRTLADDLHSLAAGPRDVLDLHAAALKRDVKAATPRSALVTEGRLLALQLMGHLASAYRRAALREVRGRR